MRVQPFFICLVLLLSLGGVSSFAQTGWFPLSSGSTENLNNVFFFGDTGYVVGDGGLILRTLDAGETWVTAPSGVTDDLNDLYFFTQDTGIIAGDNGTILRSIDAGLTWATVASGVTENLYCISFNCDQTNGVAGGSSQTILNSTDKGRTWSIVQTGFFGGEFNGADMASNNIGMIAGENSIFQPLQAKTMDGGATWDFNAFYLNSNEGQVNDIHTISGTTAIAGSSVWDGTGALSRTEDGGVNWTTILVPEDVNGLNFRYDTTGYAVGSSGTIMKSTDSGITWTDQISGTGESLNGVFFSDTATGYAVGDNGTILKTTTGGIITSVPPSDPAQPMEFVLLDNYPNPFNPSTEIRFTIGQSSFVRLVIYDFLGREVATLVNQTLPPGSYARMWNAAGMPSGVYFYGLQSGSRAETKKMMLLK